MPAVVLTPEMRDRINGLIAQQVGVVEIARRVGADYRHLRNWASAGKIDSYSGQRVRSGVRPSFTVTPGRISRGFSREHDVFVPDDLGRLTELLDTYKAYGLEGTRAYQVWRDRATALLMARAESEAA
jgi:hypothetical protein